MFLGHYGVALAAKRVAPRVSLGVLVAAAQLADLVWPVMLLLGVERIRLNPTDNPFLNIAFESYPWTHSLLASIVWGALAGLGYYALRRGGGSSTIVGLVVVSHWVLDWITHAPDMPVYPGGPRLGLGLWNSIPATMVVETLMFAGGLYLYTRSTRATDRIGRWGFASMAVTLILIYLLDSLSGTLPPSVNAICVVGLAAAAIFTSWAWWTDRHREVRT